MARKTKSAIKSKQLALSGDYPFPRFCFASDEEFFAQGFFKRHPEWIEQAKLELTDR